MSPRRRRARTGIPLALIALAAAAPARAESDCLERAAVVVYLHALQDRVLDVWGTPSDTLSGKEVVVRLRLAGDGSLLSSEVMSFTSRRLAKSVALAIDEAAPFAPVPEAAECLVGSRITLRFENPY